MIYAVPYNTEKRANVIITFSQDYGVDYVNSDEYIKMRDMKSLDSNGDIAPYHYYVCETEVREHKPESLKIKPVPELVGFEDDIHIHITGPGYGVSDNQKRLLIDLLVNICERYSMPTTNIFFISFVGQIPTIVKQDILLLVCNKRYSLSKSHYILENISSNKIVLNDQVFKWTTTPNCYTLDKISKRFYLDRTQLQSMNVEFFKNPSPGVAIYIPLTERERHKKKTLFFEKIRNNLSSYNKKIFEISGVVSND
ncbi:MAG: hypothetical protein RR420_00720 [Anaerovoracaceae bacterium]